MPELCQKVELFSYLITLTSQRKSLPLTQAHLKTASLMMLSLVLEEMKMILRVR